MAIALARRYRPRRFSDLLVQDHVTAVLRGAVARGRVGHGYLLTGPRGVGKTTAARILAMALNCPNREASGDPCGVCSECERIWSGGANLDVVEIDAASNRGVDDARDLRERAMYAASSEERYKVYIVDEAHMLTREAWNALLKILEEPPPRVVFVFATTEPLKIQQTAAPVLSRLQRFDFRRIGPGAIRARLAEVLATEGIAAEDDALVLIAKHADGGMRDALSMLDQCLSFGEGAVTAARVRDILGLVDDELYAELLRLVTERDAAAVFPLVERVLDRGADPAEFAGGAAELLRALLMVQVGAEPDDVTEATRELLARYAPALGAGDVLRMLALLAESEQALRRSGNVRLTVETLLLRWAVLDRMVDLEQVLKGGPVGGSPDGEGRAPARGSAPRAPAAPPTRQAAPAPRTASAAPAKAPRAAAPPVDAAGGSRSANADEETGAPPAAGSSAGILPFTAEALAAAWPDLVERARAQSHLLSQALAHSQLAKVAPPQVVVALTESNAMFENAFDRDRDKLGALLAEMVGTPVQVEIRKAVAPAPAARPARLTEETLRADRLKSLRAKDPALDVAATELDLEIVD